MATRNRTAATPPAQLPERQTFRSHQRAQFNAAITQAARKGGYLLDVETINGETVATIRKAVRS